jgi:hypothetical protein
MNVMITCDQKMLDWMEDKYPGILQSVRQFEDAVLPECSYCGSEDTASVQCGVIGRTIYINGATSKFRLIGNGPKEGKYFCNTCEKYFGAIDGEAAGGFTVPIERLKDIDAVVEIYRAVSGRDTTQEELSDAKDILSK